MQLRELPYAVGRALYRSDVYRLVPIDWEGLMESLPPVLDCHQELQPARQRPVYRSNLGVLNGTLAPMTVAWELFATDGSSLGTGSVDLPSWGTTQINRVLADVSPVDAAFADVWTTTLDGAFTCYGSVLDELSSDPTTVLPQ